jgi:dienelactone hydrolase
MRFAAAGWRSALRLMVLANALMLSPLVPLQAADDVSATVDVPVPSGPYPVGTFWMRLVDTNRSDPFLHNGSKRELMVRFWYPAVRVAGCAPAEYSSPKVWGYLSELLGLPAPQIRTNSCRQVPAAAGVHPVILASHGYTGMFTDYTFLFEDLASRGYVVASVAHTYETTAVEFPDGRLVTSVLGSHFAEDSLRTDDRSLQFATSVRLRDLKFVASELKRSNAAGSLLSGKFDSGRMGILGHSMGGDTAMTSLQQLGLRAGVLLDALVLSEFSTQGTDKPMLLVSEGREQWSDSECELWSNLRGPRVAVSFRGAEHLTPSDAVWLGAYVPPIHVETGTMGPEKTIAALRNYVAAFFDAYLSGKPPGLLLNGLSTDYTDGAVTTRTQPLCALPLRSTEEATLEP